MAIKTVDIVTEGKKLFVFRGKDVLIGAKSVPDGCYGVFEDSSNGAVAALASEDVHAPECAEWITLREYFATHEGADAALASRMKGLAGWMEENRFCGKCGARLKPHASETALFCPECGKLLFPRISPCIIAVIERGDEILLLRHRQRNRDIFACLAGFVETGENLEDALKREVKEETGLEIKNIRYAGSQGWPFPDQLMIGFYADYVAGELKIQESEIIEAGWFRRDALPACPGRGSISYKLIHKEI